MGDRKLAGVSGLVIGGEAAKLIASAMGARLAPNGTITNPLTFWWSDIVREGGPEIFGPSNTQTFGELFKVPTLQALLASYDIELIKNPEGEGIGFNLMCGACWECRSRNYSVAVYQTQPGVFTVERVRNGQILGCLTDVPKDEVDEAAYSASLFITEAFGGAEVVKSDRCAVCASFSYR